MLDIVHVLFPRNTDENKQIDTIFNRLEHTRDGEATYLVLIELKRLLEHGKSIGFIPELNHSGNTLITDTWSSWSAILDKSISRYESQYSREEYRKFAHNHNLSTGSRPVDLLLHPDPADLSGGGSSNIQGIKLVFTALLMLPANKTNRLNITQTAANFRTGIRLTELFYELPLDFTKDTSFESIIKLSENLINEHFRNHNSFRRFLSSLRNSLRVLNGYELGSIKNRSTSTSNVRLVHRSNKKTEKPKIVRLTPYYNPADFEDEPYIGDFRGITAEEGEEPQIGLIEPIDSTPDRDEIPEDVASASSQVKSKFWLQAYSSALPWNSRGINPLTQKILADWIHHNDSLVSLTLGLMLCTGRKVEGILQFRLSEHGEFTADGEFIRTYMPPGNSFTPSPKQERLFKTLDPIIRLPLPGIIRERFCARCNPGDYGKSLSEIWGVGIDDLKRDMKIIVRKLIRQGANGLAIDRVHLTLQKKLAEITDDDAIGYILSSHEKDMPPVSSYYSAFPHSYLVEVYQKAVEDMFT